MSDWRGHVSVRFRTSPGLLVEAVDAGEAGELFATHTRRVLGEICRVPQIGAGSLRSQSMTHGGDAGS